MSAPGSVQTATWPEMRAGAAAFVSDWSGETRERAEKDSFWNDFFMRIFGVSRRRVGVFEFAAKKHSTGGKGFIDLLVPGELAIEHKSRGRSLDEAMEQLVDYMVELNESELPHTLIVCDFETFVVRDLETSEEVKFALDRLPAEVERFAFIAGHDVRIHYETEEEANLEATRLLTDLHDALKGSGYVGHQLRVFLVRILYILFADDTQVWPKDLVHDYIVVKTLDDGSDLGRKMTEIFEVLDTPKDERSANLDIDLQDLEYVNGQLFSETIRSPTCDFAMRQMLLRACRFNWNRISPVIFGSIFQNVATDLDRRKLGAHYTSERDILRTIRPLFLDELEQKLAAAKALRQRNDRLKRLRDLRDHLPSLTFFDPACGCGNFLMLSYRELRRVELEILLAIREEESFTRRSRTSAHLGPSPLQAGFDVSLESKVTVDQFYGIELEEFPARIAETAMHLVDHRANLELSAALGDYYVRLPIKDTSHIAVGNALRMNWSEVLPTKDCTYLLGNPPFSGQYSKTDEQADDLRLVWGRRYNGYLDYVTGWYALASSYIAGSRVRVAFVSTNSICQGEPVAPLWEPLFEAGIEIDFAHRTFLWTSEADGPAGVHVVIIGFSAQGHGPRVPKLIYEYPYGGRGEPTVKRVERINAYLVDGPNVFVRPRTFAFNPELPDVFYGSKVADGGHLLVSEQELSQVQNDAAASKYLRKFIGARELIHSKDKWCLWMKDLDPRDLTSPIIRERTSKVRVMRLKGKDAEIRAAAERPAEFLRDKQPRSNYLAIPAHVGELRPYFPVGYFGPEVITGNHNFVAEDPDGYLFAVMSSRMFVTWMRGVSGRIRADLRFSKTVAWNNFPLPRIDDSQRTSLIALGQSIIQARARFPELSLSELYEPLGMPSSLLSAHRSLDKVVDKLVARRRRIGDDADRLGALFDYFEVVESTSRRVGG